MQEGGSFSMGWACMQIDHARADRVLDRQVVAIITLITLILLTSLARYAPEPWLDGFTEAMQAP